MKEVSNIILYVCQVCVCVHVGYTSYVSISWGCLVKKQIDPRFTEFLVVETKSL